ncbi:nucleotidyl transferase AbiEii/AbiGii toxin family protein [Devosia sp. LjRoot3]|uniref:nucleotidyl transferase AbiEii/AbiGii toxin family protein n=1 Tax=Devosia sp. LjRoot3 TaxID=3342319 RepID=UPI003ED08D82
MVASHNSRPSDWPRLFAIACDLLDQVQQNSGGYQFGWSFGGGTAMMIQIGHRESHDIDIFIDEAQILGFLDPAKANLNFTTKPAEYVGDGARFQKFAFADLGEIDFIVSGHLTANPFVTQAVEGREVQLETIPEIIAKKIYYRGNEAKARDIFDIAAAAQGHREEIIEALKEFPDQVEATLVRLDKLNPEFVASTIRQLMILPDFLPLAGQSHHIAKDLLVEVMRG